MRFFDINLSLNDKIDPDELFRLVDELVAKEKALSILPQLIIMDFKAKTNVEDDFQHLFEVHHKSNGYSISPSKKIVAAILHIGEWLQEQENAVRNNLKGFKKIKPIQVETSKNLLKTISELQAKIDCLKDESHAIDKA